MKQSKYKISDIFCVFGQKTAGPHEPGRKYMIFKVIFLNQDWGKAKALSHVDGIRTVVPTVVSDSLQYHKNSSWVLRKQTLDDFFKHMKKNTAWHLISAAVRVQYKQQKGEFALKQQ